MKKRVVHLFLSLMAFTSLRVFACGEACMKGLVIGQEDRRTIQEFAQDIELTEGQTRDRYRATGQLVCNGKRYSAQLTVRTNIITTTAHSFYQECNHLVDVSQCVFRTAFDNAPREFAVKGLIESGTTCPGTSQLGSDWAVAELERNVEEIAPYKEPSKIIKSLSQLVGEQVTHAAGSHWDLCEKGLCVPTLSRCTLRDLIKDESLKPIFRMDCDVGVSASGSALLVESGKDLYISSLLVSFVQAESGQNYDVNRVYSTSVPVSGRFLEVLQHLDSVP